MALSSLALSASTQSLFVEAVGKPSIQNHISAAIPYTAAIALSSVSPTSGPTTGGTSITISGTNIQSGATVAIGGLAATVSSTTSTSIIAVTPPNSVGAKNVAVTNPDGTSATLNSAFTYVAAASFALSVSPTSLSVSRGTTATYTVTVSPSNGFAGTVKFGVSGLPSGAIATFSPTSVTTSGKAKLSISTRSASRGTFTLTISGTSGTLKSTTTAKLTVK